MTEDNKRELISEIEKVHMYLQHLHIECSDQNMACINSCSVSLAKMIDMLNGKDDKTTK